MVNVFAVPGTSALTSLESHRFSAKCMLDVVFFICLRETLETSIIVSVLLAFLKQTLGPDRDPAIYKRLVRQVSSYSAYMLLCSVSFSIDLVGDRSGPPHLYHCWRGYYWGILWTRQRPLVRNRDHLGRQFQPLCYSHHHCNGCSAAPRVQASGQVARQVGKGTGGQGQRQKERKCSDPVQDMVPEVFDVHASLHHSPS